MNAHFLELCNNQHLLREEYYKDRKKKLLEKNRREKRKVRELKQKLNLSQHPQHPHGSIPQILEHQELVTSYL